MVIQFTRVIVNDHRWQASSYWANWSIVGADADTGKCLPQEAGKAYRFIWNDSHMPSAPAQVANP
ncbi:hypothetical protein [Pseudomonas fluorescens]|uniref:hypothetical protein n=1 Tax=Pseudomonas fluorescens TaxID=294 RepID=UPI000710E856|nr:hypothetical protein [Pseudomonas fluorescens]